MPVWGVWLSDGFYFSTDRRSQTGRNLARGSLLAVHLESGDDVVIVEGRAFGVAERESLHRFADAYEAKYAFRPEVEPSESSVVFRLEAGKAFAWLERDFPRTATRWIFQRRD